MPNSPMHTKFIPNMGLEKWHWPICIRYDQTTLNWTATSEFGTYRLCEQRRFRRACASAQSRLNLRCSLIQAVSQEEPSDRKPDPWPLWMAGHAQLKFVMTECLKTQIRLMGPNSFALFLDLFCCCFNCSSRFLINLAFSHVDDLKYLGRQVRPNSEDSEQTALIIVYILIRAVAGQRSSPESRFANKT